MRQLTYHEAPDDAPRWSPDGKHLYYTAPSGNVWAVSLEDGREYRVTNLVGRNGAVGWGKATDGQYLYFSWWEDDGDIWVMDVVQ
jgi:Tol biopolymer transport system component